MAALAIDKAGPRPYHFRSGPTLGPTTRPGSQKSKISVVYSLAVLKGHPECLKMRENLLAAGAPPRTMGLHSPRPPGPSWWGGDWGGGWLPLLKNPTPAVGRSGLQPWPFGPRSLPPQTRLPKSVYVVN